MPRTDLRPLAELFRARVLARLKKAGLIDDAFIVRIMRGGMSLASAWTTLRVQATPYPAAGLAGVHQEDMGG